LQFIEFGITYLMLAPSRLQVELLGDKLQVKPKDVTTDRIIAALKAVGFQNDDDIDQILSRFGPYFEFLASRQTRAVLKRVKKFLIDSGEYVETPPHPGDGDGQAYVGGLLALAGRVPTTLDARNMRAVPKSAHKKRGK
jgi:hypothetical protein